MHERYGHDRAALVATFPTFRARGAIRELGKVLGLPPGEIERVARGADGYGAARAERDDRRGRRGRPARGARGQLGALALARAPGRARPTGCPATSPSTPAG